MADKMAEPDGSHPGSWDPRDIQTLVGAYRAVMEEAGEAGLLAALSNATLSGRDLRRLVAREVIDAAATGLRGSREIVAHVLARMSAAQAAPG